jgi:hypothetical protein
MFGKPPSQGTPLTDEELLSVLQRERDAARDLLSGQIGKERQIAYDYYYGKPFGNEEPSGSKIVAQVVSEQIDSALPEIIKVFAGSDEAVQCSPRGPEDVEAAQQATDLCNYVFWTQNDGFLNTYQGVKNALLMKIGGWKYWWDKSPTVSEESYQGLTMEQLTLLQQDPEVEIVGASPSPMDPNGQLLDVTLRRKKEKGQIRIESVQPEEVLLSPRANTINPQKMAYIGTRTKKTLSDLVEMGYEVKDVEDLRSDDTDLEDAQYTRDARIGATDSNDESSGNPMMREVWYNEEYIRIDRDGDGIAELRLCCSVGDTLLHDEVVEHVQIALGTPKIMPGEAIGVSLADEVADLQLLKSTLWRETLNNFYSVNRPRYGVVEGQVNLDDILNPLPGGPIRMQNPTALMPLPGISVVGDSLPLIEYTEQEIEGRAGIGRHYQGLNPDALNKTATGMQILDTRSQARVEMICRILAEPMFKGLFQGILYLLGKHQDQAMTLRIRNQWKQVDPRAWKTQYDFTVNVGLGSGNKQQQLQQLMVLGQILQASAQAGVVTPKNAYYYAAEAFKLAGRKDYDRFITDPTSPDDPSNPRPPQQPPIELQVEEAKAKTQLQLKQADMQGEGMKLQAQAQTDLERMRGEFQLQHTNDQRQVEMERYKAELTMQIEKYKAELKAQTDLQIAQINAAATAQAAEQQIGVEREKAYVGADGEVRKAQIAAEGSDAQKAEKAQDKVDKQKTQQILTKLEQVLTEVRDLQAAPREIVRGKDGRPEGIKVGNQVRKVTRGPDGKATGIQ